MAALLTSYAPAWGEPATSPHLELRRVRKLQPMEVLRKIECSQPKIFFGGQVLILSGRKKTSFSQDKYLRFLLLFISLRLYFVFDHLLFFILVALLR